MWVLECSLKGSSWSRTFNKLDNFFGSQLNITAVFSSDQSWLTDILTFLYSDWLLRAVTGRMDVKVCELRNGLCIISKCLGRMTPWFALRETALFWSHRIMCVCVSCVRQLVLQCMLNVAVWDWLHALFTCNVFGVKALGPASGKAHLA